MPECNSLILQSTSAISNTRYLELPLCRSFILVCSTFLLSFLINPFAISNSTIANFHYVEQFPRPLQSALKKFCSEVCSFRHRSDNNMSSPKRKLSVKSLGEKCQALRDLEKGLTNKDVAEK